MQLNIHVLSIHRAVVILEVIDQGHESEYNA